MPMRSARTRPHRRRPRLRRCHRARRTVPAEMRRRGHPSRHRPSPPVAVPDRVEPGVPRTQPTEPGRDRRRRGVLLSTHAARSPPGPITGGTLAARRWRSIPGAHPSPSPSDHAPVLISSSSSSSSSASRSPAGTLLAVLVGRGVARVSGPSERVSRRRERGGSNAERERDDRSECVRARASE